MANSLVGIVDGSNIYLGVKMSDGSKRVLSYDGTYPLGTLVADGDSDFSFACVASPGVQEQQPAVVPFRFSNTVPTAPAGYETLSAELVFTAYNYDPEEALASWTAQMKVSGVTQIGAIASGDTDISIVGEPIAVEGDVQIFGDSNCRTYWDGLAKGTLYARVNVPWGFDGAWGDGQTFYAWTPDDENPNDPYKIDYYLDWSSDDSSEPYEQGAIIPLVNNDPYEMENPICIFTKS